MFKHFILGPQNGQNKNQKCFEFLFILAFEQTKEHISRQVQPLKMLNNYKNFF